MKMKTMLVTLAAAIVLVACGGGGSSSGSSMSGSMQSVATSGTITAFGSVYVNGVRYDVSHATLMKNGRAVTQDDLAVGEVALVRGRQDLGSGQGDADSVDVEDSVVGPIASISTSGTQLIVLGQTITVTATTSYSKDIVPADITGLKPGDAVEVSGFPDGGGGIVAMRIGRAEAGEPWQVLGQVSALDSSSATKTFHINGLTVDFTAAKLSGFGSGQPADGDLVVVRGTQFDSTAVKLTADTVQRAQTDPTESEDGEHAESGRVEVEGMVMNFVSATDFEVSGVKVSTNSATVFEGGSASDLANNVRIEVRGTLDSNHVLVADHVEIGHVAMIKLGATVTNVDSTSTPNTLQLLGVTIVVDADTRFEDRSDAHVQMFTLKDVHDGDTVVVRGYESPAGSGRVLASELERWPPTTMVEIRGPYTATTPPQFMILGVTIDASNASFGHFDADAGMSSADFFAKAMGQVVDVRGTAAGAMVSATQVRIDSVEDR